MTTVLLVRHGRTSANTAGVLAGRSSGVGLDERGHEQVVSVGERIAAVPVRAIVSSPLRRCRQTAQALAAARTDGLSVVTDKGLIECGYGDWSGKTLRELAKEPLWRTVQQQPSSVRFPGGESMLEMAARTTGAIRAWDAKLTAEHGPDAVWVAVSHGDPIKAILADALGMHLDSFQRIMVDPASISIIRYTDTRPYVVTANSTTTDLGAMFATPPKKSRRRSAPRADAAVGGGLGSADAP